MIPLSRWNIEYMPKVFVEDLVSGRTAREVETYFALLQVEPRQGPQQTYWLLTLSDASGQIQAYVFEELAHRVKELVPGRVYAIRGKYDPDQRRIKIRDFSLLEFYTLADLVPVTPADVQELEQTFFRFLHSVEDPPLRHLLRYLFEERQDIWEKFRKAPAAKKFHHAYLGGLLEHVVSLLALADAYARTHPDVRRDLLLSGVILHDLGKIDELTYFPVIDYTDQGRLLGHIILGYERVNQAIAELRDRGVEFPENLRLALLHMILAHHGEKAWGSPVEPHTYEAQVLHFLDNLDAKAWMFRQARESEEEGAWVWQEGLRKQVFRDY